MADFSSLSMKMNIGINASPNWSSVTELRWADVDNKNNTVSADWPFMSRPSATQGVPYAYAFTADGTGFGVFGNGGAPAAYAPSSDYRQARWEWSSDGTFGGAPVLTAYPTIAHEATITRGGGSVLEGHVTDTGATARSYLKCSLFGREAKGQTQNPDDGPIAGPSVEGESASDGITGSQSPTPGANWSPMQGLQGDNDYLTFPSTPSSFPQFAAYSWYLIFRLWTGPNMDTGTHTPVIELKYIFT